MTRLLIINPNSTASMTESIGQVAAAAAPSIGVTAIHSPDSPPAIITDDDVLAAEGTSLRLLADIDPATYDAVVIACYGDPGVRALRRATSRPVIGIGEASMLASCALAERFSVVVTVDSAVPIIRAMVASYGLADRLDAVVPVGLEVLEIATDPDRAEQRVLATIQSIVAEHGSGAVALGCAAMSPLADRLGEHVSVPVVDGIAAAVGLIASIFPRSNGVDR